MFVMPTEYIGMARVVFVNGSVEEMDIRDRVYHTMDELIMDLREEFDDDITRMDFQLDADKVVHDIGEETKRILQQF